MYLRPGLRSSGATSMLYAGSELLCLRMCPEKQRMLLLSLCEAEKKDDYL
jgi:hypothetical protein